MPIIHIRKEHTRGREAARKAVDDLAAELAAGLGIVHQWEGDTLRFTHRDARGTIAVDDVSVTIDAELGMMLGMFKGAVEGRINGYLTEKLND